MADMGILGSDQRGDDDTTEEHASRDQRDGQGSWMGAPASAEGLPHDGTHT